MTTLTVNYSSNTAITIGLETTPLASSTTWVAGRESTQIDNTTNKYVDALLSGKVTVGTTPTTNTQIRIYVRGAETSLATTALDVLDGTDSDETFTNAEMRDSVLRLAHVISVVSTTSNLTYNMPPTSVAMLFGGVMPKFWGLFVTHNTGVALNSTGSNHAFEYVGIKYDNA